MSTKAFSCIWECFFFGYPCISSFSDTWHPPPRSVDDKIEIEIENELPEVEMKEWLAVLRRIDGKRSINNQ